MTNPDVGRMVPTPHLANLIYDLAVLVGHGMITTGEAIARVGADREFRDRSTVARLAEDFWELARTQRDGESLFTALLHEWTVAHAGDDPAALFASGRAFVREATEVLIARDDAELYRRACAAADRMIATAGATAAPDAHYRAGMLHLAPYALDPVHHPDDYFFVRKGRVLGEWSRRPIYVPREWLMPEPAVGLDRAVHHLTAAAEGTTGQARGEILAQLAFAEYSRHLADGSGSLAKVDHWCAEAVALLPPVDKPLAGNRLMWLCLLRGRTDLIAQRSLVVPTAALPDGLVHTVLTGVTAIRAFDTRGRLDACGEIVDAVRRLVADDPDLQAQRLYLDLAAAHSLPGDPLGCPARWQRTQQTSPQHGPSGPAAAADRIHALVCGSNPGEPEALAAALEAVQAHAPHLSRLLRVVVAYWNWIAASRGLERHDDRAILWIIHAVISLARTGYRDLATVGVGTLAVVLDRQLAEGANVDQHEVAPAIWAMAETVFTQLRESGWWSARQCLSMLLAHWAGQETRDGDERVVITMTVLKAPGLAGALARPGPTPHDQEIASAVARLGTDRWAEPPKATQDFILTGYLHSDERELGATAEQRRANLRRRAQNADIARLMAGASTRPIHHLAEIRAALPDDGVLLSVCYSAFEGAAKDSLHMVLVPRQGRMCVASVDFLHGERNYVRTRLDPDSFRVSTTVHSRPAALMTHVRRALLEDPLHRDVSRGGALALRLVAHQLQLDGMLGKPLTFVIEGGHTRLIFWPHESLYFIPLHLLPFRDGILADHFTVTVLPSVKCLFPRSDTVTVRPGVAAIACATGGLSAGLPEEPSVHQQAERIADLFDTRPLTGSDATPAAVLEALGTTRYLHLAAHGTQDVDAPLFARVYLAGGTLHAHEILQRDLRGTELVTLSACESALLRYDFLDNLHGLVPAFLRAGARAVIGALWPVSPEVAETFFTELYAHLANGSTRVDAFRFAQNQARARHPNYRDWGAFTYFGS